MSLWRPIAFLSCAAFIVLAPAQRHVFDGPLPLPRWEMFRGASLDVYKVRFETDAAEGGRRVLDRFEVLGYESPAAAPRMVRLITRESQAHALATRLCTRLGGKAVYMRVEDAKPYGWRVVDDGRQNVCASDSRTPGNG